MYTKIIDVSESYCFLQLSLYLASSVELLIIYLSFLVESLISLVYYILLFQNRDNLILFLFVSFNFFSCLIASASTSITILKRRGYPIIPYFNGVASNFSPFRIMLAVNFSYIAFVLLRCVFSSPTLSRTSIMKICQIFVLYQDCFCL